MRRNSPNRSRRLRGDARKARCPHVRPLWATGLRGRKGTPEGADRPQRREPLRSTPCRPCAGCRPKRPQLQLLGPRHGSCAAATKRASGGRQRPGVHTLRVVIVPPPGQQPKPAHAVAQCPHFVKSQPNLVRFAHNDGPRRPRLGRCPVWPPVGPYLVDGWSNFGRVCARFDRCWSIWGKLESNLAESGPESVKSGPILVDSGPKQPLLAKL